MHLSLEETKKFIGISILMSCMKFPQIKMYWAASTCVEPIARNMTRRRLFNIRSHLKVVVDSDIPKATRENDKLWKISPFADKIRNGCLSLDRRSTVVDVQIIPFTGVCKVKQFVRGKPNPEGLKKFVCATSNGLVDFEIHRYPITMMM